MSLPARVGIGVAITFWLAVAVLVWRGWPALEQFVDPGRTRRFYIPSESMLPTLQVGDRIRPLQAVPADLRRGTVIVFDGPTSARVDRIVGVAGDTVAVRGGTVVLDGVAVATRDVGAGPTQDGTKARLLMERLPGEPHSHLIIDAGQSAGDDFGPIKVPAGTLFVLGDNRDRSADSRYSTDVEGVGLVKTDAVVGVVDRLMWASGFHNLGRPIDAAGAR